MDGGTDAICYTMKPCTTEEDVRTHCGSLIYDYSEGTVPISLLSEFVLMNCSQRHGL